MGRSGAAGVTLARALTFWALALTFGALAQTVGAQAQTEQGPRLSQGTPQLPFVTLDDARLFADSAWGQALLRRLEAEQAALAAENREIEARLAEQEQALTARRPDLAPAEFRALADGFNAEVETWRTTQKGKEQAVYQRHEAARLRFRDVANQVLAQLMAERGALAIIAEEAIVLGFREIDITGDAVARLDALVGDGSGLPEPGPRVIGADPALPSSPEPEAEAGTGAEPGPDRDPQPVPEAGRGSDPGAAAPAPAP